VCDLLDFVIERLDDEGRDDRSAEQAMLRTVKNNLDMD
jgi:hypothetical protein